MISLCNRFIKEIGSKSMEDADQNLSKNIQGISDTISIFLRPILPNGVAYVE
jgi:hypothetical protein